MKSSSSLFLPPSSPRPSAIHLILPYFYKNVKSKTPRRANIISHREIVIGVRNFRLFPAPHFARWLEYFFKRTLCNDAFSRVKGGGYEISLPLAQIQPHRAGYNRMVERQPASTRIGQTQCVPSRPITLVFNDQQPFVSARAEVAG